MDQFEFDYDKCYYKVLNFNKNHFGFQYKPGLNVDVNTKIFNKSIHGQDTNKDAKNDKNTYDPCPCNGYGLHFVDLDAIGYYCQLGVYLQRVYVPKDTIVVRIQLENDTYKYRAPQLILDDFCLELNSLECFAFLCSQQNDNNEHVYRYPSMVNLGVMCCMICGWHNYSPHWSWQQFQAVFIDFDFEALGLYLKSDFEKIFEPIKLVFKKILSGSYKLKDDNGEFESCVYQYTRLEKSYESLKKHNCDYAGVSNLLTQDIPLTAQLKFILEFFDFNLVDTNLL